jgi:glycine cleavage system H protein
MNNPSALLYSKTHEWIDFLDDNTAKVGLTDFAQNALGDLVFVNLPEVGDEVERGAVAADVESVKAVSDVYSPLSGRVTAVNEDLIDSPELINQNPYGTWLFEIGDVTDKEELLTAKAYEQFCEEEE